MPDLSMGLTVLWIAIIIGGIAVEVATFNLVSVWFAVGALAAFLTLSLGGTNLVQLVVFALVSALTLVLIRPLAKDILKPRGAKTNADRIIGEIGYVTQRISNADATGQIKVSGQIWSAKSADNSVIDEGETVKVLSISGVKTIVSRQ